MGSTGSQGLKSITSNYGLGVVDVVAPGGDARLQPLADEGGGRVLSTWPSKLSSACLRRLPQTEPDPTTGVYCYQQGTSMATPHATGVAALLMSRAIEQFPSGFDKNAIASLLRTGDDRPPQMSVPSRPFALQRREFTGQRSAPVVYRLQLSEFLVRVWSGQRAQGRQLLGRAHFASGHPRGHQRRRLKVHSALDLDSRVRRPLGVTNRASVECQPAGCTARVRAPVPARPLMSAEI